jgi:hypothetical protein
VSDELKEQGLKPEWDQMNEELRLLIVEGLVGHSMIGLDRIFRRRLA